VSDTLVAANDALTTIGPVRTLPGLFFLEAGSLGALAVSIPFVVPPFLIVGRKES